MIPILYDNAERRFITNGIGRLSDCISCKVTEERNGIYECEFTYPITGEHYSEIKEGMVIGVTHDETGDIQPFDIYRHEAPIDGVVTFNAHHISYRLSNVVVMPFSATSPADALSGIESHSANTNPFLFWTDKGGTGTFEVTKPDYCRAILGGQQGSVLDAFGGGEYEWDRFTVKLYANRGNNTQVQIRYGKNLADITEKTDTSDTYNAIVPFWQSTEGTLVTLPEEVIVYSGATLYETNLTNQNLIIIRDHNNEPITLAYSQINAIPFDMSSDFQDEPTVNELRNAAISKFNASQAWLPQQNIDVDFVQLWQTEEYKNYAPLQRVSLCDTVSVFYDALGVNAVDMKVVKTVWNVLLDRYDSMELGQTSSTLAEAIAGPIEAQIKDSTESMMAQAIQYATDLIRGGLGGYIVMKPNAQGQPEELLIMDTPDINTAVNVWRWNLNGLGHSHNGYDGPFDDMAITQDGRINANMITAGRLNANYIQGGTLTLGGIGDQFGVFHMKNDSNYTTGSWDRYGLFTTATNIGTMANVYYPYTNMSAGKLTFGKYDGVTRTAGAYFQGPTAQNADAGDLFLYGTTFNTYLTGSIQFMRTVNNVSSAMALFDMSNGSISLYPTSMSISIDGHVASGTGQKVIIPSALGSNGNVTSSYTLYLRCGLLCTS